MIKKRITILTSLLLLFLVAEAQVRITKGHPQKLRLRIEVQTSTIRKDTNNNMLKMRVVIANATSKDMMISDPRSFRLYGSWGYEIVNYKTKEKYTTKPTMTTSENRGISITGLQSKTIDLSVEVDELISQKGEEMPVGTYDMRLYFDDVSSNVVRFYVQ